MADTTIQFNDKMRKCLAFLKENSDKDQGIYYQQLSKIGLLLTALDLADQGLVKRVHAPPVESSIEKVSYYALTQKGKKYADLLAIS